MRSRAPILCVVLLGSACGSHPGDEDDFVEDLTTLPEDEGKADGPSRVEDYLGRGCTTAPVLPLAQQIAERIACTSPEQTVRFDPSAHVHFVGAAILPFLDPHAVADLEAAAAEVGVLQLNSVYRTLPQQYLLYNWRARGRCGISAAARPGDSNHETGRAMDVANYGAARQAMARHGWKESVANDPVHFDHVSSPDERGLDVLAFQQLWNLNHPGDAIDVDGDYGPQTEARLRVAPAKGFAIAGCGDTP